MRNHEWDLLFWKYDLHSVLDAQLRSINERVIKIDQRRFELESDEMLAASIASELVVAPLELDEDEISVSSKDTKIDVSGDFDRAVLDRSRPAYIDGVEVTYHLPYRGDNNLLQCRPSSFTLNPPRAIVAQDELQFPYSRPDRDIGSTKGSFHADLRQLKQWLPWVNQQVEDYNSSVESAVRQRIAQRRQELKRANDDLGALGFKVRTQDQGSRQQPLKLPQEEVVKKRASIREQTRRTYDVALSFAGEDRDYVEQVAEQLRKLGVTVFYDRFEEVDLWGKDLGEHLGLIYGKDSRFVVLFLSRSYGAKAWPNHEKRFALGQQITSGKQRILPVRFDDTEIPGLPPTISYLDLRVLTPQKLAELIRQKVDQADV